MGARFEEQSELAGPTLSSKCVSPYIEVNEYSVLSPPVFTCSFLRVRHRDMLRMLKNRNEDSATGPDLVASRKLKACAEVLALQIVLVARRILQTHRWRQLWTEHWIAVLHKKKSVSDATNYLGIHITSQASRVIKRVLRMHLFRPLIKLAFTESQFAYRPK